MLDVPSYTFDLASVHTDDDRPTLGVRQGHQRQSKVFRGDADRLPLEPLIFRDGRQRDCPLIDRQREDAIDLVRRHQSTLNSLE